MTWDNNLFPPELLHKLFHLRILLKHKKQNQQGAKKSAKTGKGTDFLEYRPYVPGDDIRDIDWYVSSRSQEIFTKHFSQEQNSIVWVLVDASLSMSLGKPKKFDTARQIAAGLSYISLLSGHKLRIGFVQDFLHLSPDFSQQQFSIILRFLSNFKTHSTADLKTICQISPKNTQIFFISDLFAIPETLIGILSKKNTISLIHCLAPQEITPQLQGNLSLVDIETHEEMQIFVNEATVQEYKQLLQKFQNRWKNFCAHHAINYHFVIPEVAIEKTIAQSLGYL